MTTRVAGLLTIAPRGGEFRKSVVSFWKREAINVRQANYTVRANGWLETQQTIKKLTQRNNWALHEAHCRYYASKKGS